MYVNENSRYERQLLLKEVGITGQKKLGQSRVLVIGAGGLGSPVLFYLASAGVGNITIIDSDVVKLSNLNRQFLYSASDLDKPKAKKAAKVLGTYNSDIKIEFIQSFYDLSNAEKIVRRHDIVLDAVDTFETKYLINDICVRQKVPFVHGGVSGFRGQLFLWADNTACLRCIFPDFSNIEESPNKGIIGATAGVIGSLQAMEAICYLVSGKSGLQEKMLFYDGLRAGFFDIPREKRSDCQLCKVN